MMMSIGGMTMSREALRMVKDTRFVLKSLEKHRLIKGTDSHCTDCTTHPYALQHPTCNFTVQPTDCVL